MFRIISHVAICLTLTGLTSSTYGMDEAIPVRDRVSADTPSEKAANYRAIFDKVSPFRLNELLRDPSPEIRCFAAWECCINDLVQFEPDPGSPLADYRDINTGGKVYRLPKSSVCLFIQRLQKILGVDVPSFWQSDLAGGWAIKGDFLFGEIESGLDKEFQSSFVDSFGSHILHPANMKIYGGDKLTVERSGLRFQIPVHALPMSKADDYVRIASALLSKNSAYLAYGDQFGICGWLVCYDRTLARIRWTAKLWQSYSRTSESPNPNSRTGSTAWFDIVAGDHEVTLFGISERGASFESFDKVSGKCIVRFSSTYWEHRGAFRWW